MTRRQLRVFDRMVRRMSEVRLFTPEAKGCATEGCGEMFWVLAPGERRRKFCDPCRRDFGIGVGPDPRTVVDGAVLAYPDNEATLRALIAVRLAKGEYVGMLLRGCETPMEEVAA